MQNIIVSHVDNVEKDEEGNFLLDDDGVPALKDDNDVGMLIRTHTIQVSQLDNTQLPPVLVTGVVFKSEVLWNMHRCPAPAMVDPQSLVWLTIDDDRDEDDAEEEEEIEHDDDTDHDQEGESRQVSGH